MTTAPHVLLVEDDPDLRAALAERLTHAGLRVTCASDAVRGFLRAEAGDVDIAVVDLGLPTVSGFDLLDHLSHDIGIPAIVVTGADPETAERARRFGALDVLRKPTRGDRVVAAIRSAVGPAAVGRALLLE